MGVQQGDRTVNKLDGRISELQRDLDLLAHIEDTARSRLAGADEDWNREADRIVEKLCTLVVSFKIEDPPHKAVNIIGQLIADVEKLRSPKRICTEIDNKRKLLHALRDQSRKREASTDAARRAYDQYHADSTRGPEWLAGG